MVQRRDEEVNCRIVFQQHQAMPSPNLSLHDCIKGTERSMLEACMSWHMKSNYYILLYCILTKHMSNKSESLFHIVSVSKCSNWAQLGNPKHRDKIISPVTHCWMARLDFGLKRHHSCFGASRPFTPEAASIIDQSYLQRPQGLWKIIIIKVNYVSLWSTIE
jgi:hypothetical protein